MLAKLRDVARQSAPAAQRTLRRIVDRRGEHPAPAAAPDPRDVVARMESALKDHDLDALVACFHPDYRGEQPLHPREPAVDRDQLRRNWETFFTDVPDVRTDMLDSAVEGDSVWSEWRIYGTRRDGAPLDLRAVWIFGVRGGKVAWGRLYREPLDLDDVPDTVDRLTRPS